MENIMNEFKKLAPFITENVKSRISNEMTDKQVMNIIHEEIIAYFNKQQQMTMEYLAFNEDKRISFAAVMYEILAPLASVFKDAVNPKYAEYVESTGKSGALNFITGA